ncbi:MBL fold metallo-hydrolase [Gemmatimonadetes bacterium T265]|nr:MBL fold metallo-hydrolase [Gemmatimonadetes bacterium T265]
MTADERLVLVCWGVRGSVPSPGPATARYGGNTPCAELRAPDGRRLLLDAGTGMRPLGAAWGPGPDVPDREVDVLVSHAHGDHLHGLGFFAPFVAGHARLTLHTAATQVAAVEAGVRAILAPPLFPTIDGLLGRVQVRGMPADATTRVAGFDVRPIDAAHPGGATGFRVTDPDDGGSLVYLPDNELAAAEGVCGGRRALLDGVAGADLLVHDATYLPAELARHRGWGHSSYAEAVRLASDADVGRLMLHHHHPSRDDAAVDRLLGVAKALGEASRPGVEVLAAVEGEEVRVG